MSVTITSAISMIKSSNFTKKPVEDLKNNLDDISKYNDNEKDSKTKNSETI